MLGRVRYVTVRCDDTEFSVGGSCVSITRWEIISLTGIGYLLRCARLKLLALLSLYWLANPD